MATDTTVRNQYGRITRNDIHTPCPNPRCNKKRSNHTRAQALICEGTAMADA